VFFLLAIFCKTYRFRDIGVQSHL